MFRKQNVTRYVLKIFKSICRRRITSVKFSKVQEIAAKLNTCISQQAVIFLNLTREWTRNAEGIPIVDNLGRQPRQRKRNAPTANSREIRLGCKALVRQTSYTTRQVETTGLYNTMQMQVLTQLHRSNLAVALPSSRPFSPKSIRSATSAEVTRRPGALLRPQYLSTLPIAKRVEAEVVPEEVSTSQVEGFHTEDAQTPQTSAPWKLFRKLCQVVTVGALCLAMVGYTPLTVVVNLVVLCFNDLNDPTFETDCKESAFVLPEIELNSPSLQMTRRGGLQYRRLQ